MAKVKSKKSEARGRKSEVKTDPRKGGGGGTSNAELRTPNFQPKIETEIAGVHFQNTRCGGMVYGNDPTLTEEVVGAAKRAARRPLFVKLSPNVTDITVLARAAESAGADALSLVNTFVGMAIDIERREPRISNLTAGLSGPAIKPVALRMVYQTARAVKIPVIGIGGIQTAEDALEYIIAGAKAVQVGTANFYAPSTSLEVVKGIEEYCRRKRYHLRDLVGSLRVPSAPGMTASELTPSGS